ncbi:MAG: hypothetical protein O2826_04930 [Chloroflexi bacterium]|nr:hypothetical protein [Chloroflexota bacterium]MDA1173848.1 hypothetical protein [Chloroflexota bacterium]
MPTTVELLAALNRKERFFLVAEALGKPTFELSAAFRERVGDAFDLSIPTSAFVAMDYHLDWIYASLFLSDQGVDASGVHANPDGLISGNQEDVDLIIAFEAEGLTHIIMLEAKAETGWTNKQAGSKASRLEAIFGSDGRRFPASGPHYGLISPRPPQQLATKEWPRWMLAGDGTVVWMPLTVPPQRAKVTRVNESNHPDAAGKFFSMKIRKP